MNQVNPSIPESWISRTADTAAGLKSSVTINQHRALQNGGHKYTSHTGLVHQSHTGLVHQKEPQFQSEKKADHVRKEWSTNTIRESFTSTIQRVVTSFVAVPKALWKEIHQIRLAISNFFKSNAVKSTQSLLKDQKIKDSLEADGTLKFKEKVGEKEIEKTFSMPHQMNRDLKGCRYYLGNDDLAEKAFQDLKNQGIKKDGDLEEGAHPGSDLSVRLNAGLLIEKQFGRQGMLNIASILTQAVTPDLQSHIDKMGGEYYGQLAGSKNATHSSFPEFHIEDQNGSIKMSMLIYLAVYPKTEDGYLNIDIEPSYVVGKREITLSKEELQKDWTRCDQSEIAPSLKVNDSYSSFHKSLNGAKKQMGLLKTQSS